MTRKEKRSRLSMLSLMPYLLLCVAVVLPLLQWRFDNADQWASELRQKKIQRLQLVRALGILRDNSAVVLAVTNNPHTVQTITLALIEALKQQALVEQVELTQLSVSDTQLQQPSSEMRILRVGFAVVMRRAMSLLSLFDVIDEAAGWRPIEVRGCSVNRISNSEFGLHATCAVDVYYFPAVDK